MRHQLALSVFCTALAACSATPIHSLDAEQNKSPSFVASGRCSINELMPDAKSACSTFKVDASGESLLWISAIGPETWTSQIAVEIYDATSKDNGPLCAPVFAGNGIQECGRFVIDGQAILGASVTVTPNVPTGVRLLLLSDSQ